MTPKKPRVDWDAVERDYRTGKFTDQELADKHGNRVTRQAISKRAKEKGWQKDLSAEVRRATRASLIREQVATRVAEQVAGSCQEATVSTADAVLAAAEVNKQVILQHRGDLQQARQVTMDLLAELAQGSMLAGHMEQLAQLLAGSGAEPKDEAEARKLVSRALGLGGRVSSVKALADAITKLQEAERRAFGLDDQDGDDPADDDDAERLRLLDRADQAALLEMIRKARGSR